MVNRQYRIDDEAHGILLRHKGVSVTLSDAVRNMENKIVMMEGVSKVTQQPQKPTQFVSGSDIGNLRYDSPVPVFDKEYWKKLEQTVDLCIEKAKRY